MKLKTSFRLLLASLFAAGGLAVAHAQSTTMVDPSRRAGEREFTMGGSGVSNKDFDDSLGGFNFSYGWYTSDTQAWTLRQSINYANPDRGATAWNGSTRLAFDQHLTARGPFRPFIGVNFGGIYGDAVRDTWTAGLEGGVKMYVQSRTFVFAMIDYGWLFRDADNIDNSFNDGAWTWTAGVGFNF